MLRNFMMASLLDGDRLVRLFADPRPLIGVCRNANGMPRNTKGVYTSGANVIINSSYLANSIISAPSVIAMGSVAETEAAAI